jgi:hypothetical protein
VAAADVGDADAGMQPRLEPIDRGDPGRREVGRVARPEEPLGSDEQVVMVLVPADAFAGREGGAHGVLVPRCKDPATAAAHASGMSTTTMTNPHTATVNTFLLAIAAGDGIPKAVYATDATLDATVPNWRFTVHGADAIVAEYGRWFAHPGSFTELTRHPLLGGEVITYLLTWTENGIPHAAHHCHVLAFDANGRIASDTVFCGGRWPADLIEQMAAGS